MTARKLAVVSAGLSDPSSTRLLADQLAAATMRDLRERGIEPSSSVIELREHAHDITNNLLTGFPIGQLPDAITSVVQADGLVVVTPIFNASYSGLFKSFFDVLDNDLLTDKPVLIAATGGTARHSLALEHALRPMFVYLHTIVVPTAVYAASEDWGAGGNGGQGLKDRINRAARELGGLMHDRASVGPIDPFDDPTPFEQLLAGG